MAATHRVLKPWEAVAEHDDAVVSCVRIRLGSMAGIVDSMAGIVDSITKRLLLQERERVNERSTCSAV